MLIVNTAEDDWNKGHDDDEDEVVEHAIVFTSMSSSCSGYIWLKMIWGCFSWFH